MRHTRSHPGFWLAASAAMLACAAHAGESATPALEARLRAQRPDVIRWEMRVSETRANPKEGDAAIVRVGHIAPRTAVRFADGRVRWYAVAGFAPVLLSNRIVEAGAALAAADTARAERDVIALGCEPLTHIDSDRRLRVTRRIASGAPLCIDAVQAAPQVERNRPVVLRAQRGPVSASRVLTATRDANTGERIRLRDPASGATVVAVVTGQGVARDPNSQEQK